jgi:formyl-CoA transferase
MQEVMTMFLRTIELEKWGKAPVGRHGYLRGRSAGGLYQCKGDGANDWMFIYPATTQMWDVLCTVIDRPDLLHDPRFQTGEGRVEHIDEIYTAVSAWTACHEKREAMRILGDAGVPCAYVFDTIDLFEDEHLRSRDFVQTLEHPIAGPVRLLRHPLRMSGVEQMELAPMLGEHTDEVLHEYLGLTDAEIDDLQRQGVTKRNS